MIYLALWLNSGDGIFQMLGAVYNNNKGYGLDQTTYYYILVWVSPG